MLKINCPNCRREIEISSDKLGEVVICDFCRKSFPAGSSPRSGISAGNGVKGHPSAEPLSDGKIREVELNGTFYDLSMLRRIRKRYFVFTVLVLLQIACLLINLIRIPLPAGFDLDDIASPLSLFVFSTAIPSFMLYIMLVLALNESFLSIFVKLNLLVMPFLVLMNSNGNPAFLVLACFMFFSGQLLSIVKAAVILKTAKIPPPGRNRYMRAFKRYAFLFLPLLISFVLLILLLALGLKMGDAFFPFHLYVASLSLLVFLLSAIFLIYL